MEAKARWPSYSLSHRNIDDIEIAAHAVQDLLKQFYDARVLCGVAPR